jgi:hypothetical protein
MVGELYRVFTLFFLCFRFAGTVILVAKIVLFIQSKNKMVFPYYNSNFIS